MIEFSFDSLRTEGKSLDDQAAIFVDINSRFVIQSRGRTLYEEQDFPVVELAADLAGWLAKGMPKGKDFKWDSMSTPETGWVWIRRVAGGFRVGSLHQDFPDPTPYSAMEIESATRAFLTNLISAVERELGIDVRQYLRIAS